MEREYFSFYKSFFDAIDAIPEKNQRAAYRAIIAYALLGEEPKLQGIEKAIFLMAKPQIDANNQRFSNGSKGGCPKGKVNNPQGANQYSKAKEGYRRLTKEDNQGLTKEDNQSKTEDDQWLCSEDNGAKAKKESIKYKEENIKEKFSKENFPLTHNTACEESEFFDQYFHPNNSAQLEQIVMNLHSRCPTIQTIADYRTLAMQITAGWQISQTRHHDYSDWARHLFDTAKIEADNLGKIARANTKAQQPSKPNPFDDRIRELQN